MFCFSDGKCFVFGICASKMNCVAPLWFLLEYQENHLLAVLGESTSHRETTVSTYKEQQW